MGRGWQRGRDRGRTRLPLQEPTLRPWTERQALPGLGESIQPSETLEKGPRGPRKLRMEECSVGWGAICRRFLSAGTCASSCPGRGGQ